MTSEFASGVSPLTHSSCFARGPSTPIMDGCCGKLRVRLFTLRSLHLDPSAPKRGWEREYLESFVAAIATTPLTPRPVGKPAKPGDRFRSIPLLPGDPITGPPIRSLGHTTFIAFKSSSSHQLALRCPPLQERYLYIPSNFLLVALAKGAMIRYTSTFRLHSLGPENPISAAGRSCSRFFRRRLTE